jgi:hypothetical protein
VLPLPRWRGYCLLYGENPRHPGRMAGECLRRCVDGGAFATQQ